MLLVCDEQTARELSGPLGEARIERCGDPFEALLAMSRRQFRTVILCAPRVELASLARAARRLAPSAKTVALCQVADEPEVRQLVGEVLDDYFIYPPTAGDLDELRRLAGDGSTAFQAVPGHTAARTGLEAAEPMVPAGMVRQLVESSRSMADLEAMVAALVGEVVGAKVAWCEAAQLPVGASELLRINGPAPRVLHVATNVGGGAPVPPPVLDTDDLGSLNSRRDRSPAAHQEKAGAALEALAAILPALAESTRRAESLHQLAVTDHLTGAFNRRYFYHVTDQILSRAAPDERIALLLYDIDDFKKYNEAFGYAVGDGILRQTAELMRSTSRSHDVVARIGGDEFAVLFWDAQGPRTTDSQPLQTAYDLAERFRAAVSTQDFSMLGPNAVGDLSISGGLALFPRDGKDVRELLRAANKALKAAKLAGKNGIQIVG